MRGIIYLYYMEFSLIFSKIFILIYFKFGDSFNEMVNKISTIKVLLTRYLNIFANKTKGFLSEKSGCGFLNFNN